MQALHVEDAMQVLEWRAGGINRVCNMAAWRTRESWCDDVGKTWMGRWTEETWCESERGRVRRRVSAGWGPIRGGQRAEGGRLVSFVESRSNGLGHRHGTAKWWCHACAWGDIDMGMMKWRDGQSTQGSAKRGGVNSVKLWGKSTV